MKIELVQQTTQPTLYVRLTTSLDRLTKAFDENFALIENYLSEIGEQSTSPPYAAYYNSDMQNLDVEMGFPVAKYLPGRDKIKSGTLPSIPKAVCGTHKGSYSSLNETYEQVYKYVADNNFEVSGAHYDFYISNPDNTSENELITRIVIPVKEIETSNMENMLFCQSCSMPMQKSEEFGVNQDGSKNKDYCVYCYKDGRFTDNMTMDEMIDSCIKHMNTMFKDDPSYNEKNSLENMKAFFPKLKRWNIE